MRGTCKPAGELDGATAPAFTAEVRDVIDCSDEAVVVVDCSDVTFMGSAGYRALVDANTYATRVGHTLVIRNLSRSCARLLRLCDQEHELRTDESFTVSTMPA